MFKLRRCLLTGFESHKHSVILADALCFSKHQSLGSDNIAWARSVISIVKARGRHLSSDASISVCFLDHVKNICFTGFSLARYDGFWSSQLDGC
ncbi:hypothetical protein HZ326_28784 [Fusarium oxysporum f. sp. albedinis]|nr:hypothetical protein HZ326_28784 [Fusarium oxysporum f. sp. albedinis]